MQRSGSLPAGSDHCGVCTRQGKVLLRSPTNSERVVFLGDQLVIGLLCGDGAGTVSPLCRSFCREHSNGS